MKEIIIVAGKNRVKVGWLRRYLRQRNYHSIPCKTAKAIIDELNVLPTCGGRVSLVVVDPAILEDISDDLVARLDECALDVPFILLDRTELSDDLTDTFEQICTCRAKFMVEQNHLADVLQQAGVEMA